MSALQNKIDFALVIAVHNANPNGDPLNGKDNPSCRISELIYRYGGVCYIVYHGGMLPSCRRTFELKNVSGLRLFQELKYRVI